MPFLRSPRTSRSSHLSRLSRLSRPVPSTLAGLVLAVAGALLPAVPSARAAAPSPSTSSGPSATAVPAGPRPELVPWETKTDFAAALARAKKQKKPVFIDFYATWCGPCKMMDRNTYSDEDVARAASRFVNLKIDAEKGEGITLAKRYGVTAYPTMVVVDATGKELNRAQGYRPPTVFAQFLDDTREGRGTIEGLEKLLAAGQDTYLNRVALGEKYAERGEAAKAREHFERAIALDPADAQGRAAGLLLLLAGSERSSGAHADAVRDYERFLALFPSSPRSLEARSGLAVSLAESGRPDEAFALYRKIAEERPDDAQVQSSLARFSAALKVGMDDGLAAGRKAVALTEGGAAAYDALAEIHAARGEWDEAVIAAEKALEKRPTDNYLRGRLEKYQEGAAAAVRSRSQSQGQGQGGR
jgi:thioredoxin-like negative regulator of GroEL